jgi:hypothetical protein
MKGFLAVIPFRRAWGLLLATGVVAAGPVLAAEQQTAAQPAQQAATTPVAALTDTGWPRTITGPNVSILLYQPQVDSWDGFHLTGRAAVAATETGAKSPQFGIITFSAQTLVNKDTRLVAIERFTITSASFDMAGPKARAWTSLIEKRVATFQPIALDRLEAALEVTEAEHQGSAVPLRNDPPLMLFSTAPAMLVPIDGEPVYRAVPGTSVERIINMRPLMLREQGRYYLKIFDGWMEAGELTGPWSVAASVPKDCNKALQAEIKAKSADLLVGGDPKDPSTRPSLKKGPVPVIHVETKPAELIVTDGPPDYTPIEGTTLLYAKNTTGNLFVDTANQQAYVLVSGRWFAGPSVLSGPWQFVANDALPAAFKAIPDTSPKENIKASVAGTPQAQEAVVANSIPQTAKVSRSQATFTPEIDGAPQITAIEGTTLRYVVNSARPIIVVGDPIEYYGVENGVWFVARSLSGPWLVATSVPAAIYSIPATSPVHYVTYVRVYDYTPDDVIVGYTPGYYGAYVAGGCVVYGTGYPYSPWIGSVWYGPPVTYGFGVNLAYTPWAGWHVGFGFGWSWGAATVSIGWGWGAYPWWGPAWGWGGAYPWVYSPVYGAAWGPRGGSAVWGPGYWSGSTGNVYSHWGANTAVTRSWGGYNAWTGNSWAGRSGMAYNSRTGTLAAGQRAGVQNVYTGNYAAGSRGAAYNPSTGVGVSGGRVTAGNAYTGNQVTAGRGTVTGPGGRSNTITSVRGDGGSVISGNNNTFAGHDGNVYRHTDDGGWSKWERGNWGSAGGSNLGQLDRERGARMAGENRWSNFNSGGFRGGGMGRFRR